MESPPTRKVPEMAFKAESKRQKATKDLEVFLCAKVNNHRLIRNSFMTEVNCQRTLGPPDLI